MIGTKYNHKYMPGLSCEITAETAKGYKVAQTYKGKTKVQFYNRLDFTKDKGLWTALQREYTVTMDPLGWPHYQVDHVQICRVFLEWHLYNGAELVQVYGDTAEQLREAEKQGLRIAESFSQQKPAPIVKTPTLFNL